MTWATVSFQSCFCQLYRTSLSLASKNIINLILVLTIWWCPCVESSLVLLEECVCQFANTFSLQNSVSLCLALFCTPRPNLPVTSGIFWLPTFVFQSPIMKRTSFGGFLESLVGLHRTNQIQLLQHYWLGHAASAAAKSLQFCPTLCNPTDGSPPGSPSLRFSRQEHWSGLPSPSPIHESEKWKWSCSVVSNS